MPVTINSILLSADGLKPETVDAIRNACISGSVAEAHRRFGPTQNLTVRDLEASDYSFTNNVWTDTSNATANAWNAIAQAAFTVATGTVIGIYGIRVGFLMNATITQPSVTGFRLDVGGARVAQWNVEKLMLATALIATPANVFAYGQQWPLGVTKSPIIVGEDITVTIYEYTRTASTVYYPIWEGVAVEKEGRTLKP